jgi:hypothetical protein
VCLFRFGHDSTNSDDCTRLAGCAAAAGGVSRGRGLYPSERKGARFLLKGTTDTNIHLPHERGPQKYLKHVCRIDTTWYDQIAQRWMTV